MRRSNGQNERLQHFCTHARTLEVIGEKWSLLIVRDLLLGPQRFTDFLQYLGRITPKWLSLRLRDLEAAGIVNRNRVAGRREVWCELTPVGKDLLPVIQALAVWGIDHAMRPPRPDEPIHPEQTLRATATYLNAEGIRLSRPANWEFRFNGTPYFVQFEGEHWKTEPAKGTTDVVVTTRAREWVSLLLAQPDERPCLLKPIDIRGAGNAVVEFLATIAGAWPG